MGRWADAADARCDLRHVLGRPPLRELLESAQLGHLEKRAVDAALLVEEDFDLAVPLEPGNGINGDSASSVHNRHSIRRRPSIEDGRL
jgi:hypothetical protein